MWRLIKFIFTGDGHLHKWKIHKEIPMQRHCENRVAYRRFILQCEVCGDIKIIDGE